MRAYEPEDDEMMVWSRDVVSPAMHENFPASAMSTSENQSSRASPQMPPFAFDADRMEPAHF